MRKPTSYLLLDKDDITKVCGVMSRQEILKEITPNDLANILVYDYKFRDKYILIEKDFEEEKNDITYIKFDETKDKYYYASRDGEFFTISKKTRKKRVLTKHLHCGRAIIKANNKQYIAKNLIAKLFLKSNSRDKVEVKNGDIFDCSVNNLIVTPWQKHLVQIRNAEAQRVGLYEDGKLVKTWRNATECAKELCYSRNAIYDFIKKDRNNLAYDLRFI